MNNALIEEAIAQIDLTAYKIWIESRPDKQWRVEIQNLDTGRSISLVAEIQLDIAINAAWLRIQREESAQ